MTPLEIQAAHALYHVICRVKSKPYLSFHSPPDLPIHLKESLRVPLPS